MQFFKRIMTIKHAIAGRRERRSRQRYFPSPKFTLKTVLNVVGRDESGAVLQNSRGGGWDWSGRLVNFSDLGATVQLPLSLLATRGDLCQLKLSLDGHQLTLSGRIKNIRDQPDSKLLGVSLEITEAKTQLAYRQLVELVAMGSTLKPLTKGPIPDGTGYLVEKFAGDKHSKLCVWRQIAGRSPTAFEFQLKDCRVRGSADRRLEYLTGLDPATERPATSAQTAEIHRLFHWVVPNLPGAVPSDVREFLRGCAA